MAPDRIDPARDKGNEWVDEDSPVEKVTGQIIASVSMAMQKRLEEFQSEVGKKADERDADLCVRLERRLDEAIESYKKTMEQEHAKYSLPGAPKNLDPDTGEGEFSIARAAYAIGQKNSALAPLEFEVFTEMAKRRNIELPIQARDMSTTVDSAGGYIVPEENIRPIIELLKTNAVALQLGAVEVPVTGSPVQIPKKTSAATAYWVDENDTITKSQVAIGQVTAQPHTLAARTAISNNLMRMSVPTVEQVIVEDFGEQLGLGLDAAILAGTGASGQPIGITNTSGVNTTALGAATAQTYLEWMGFHQALRLANALRGKLGWAMHPATMNEVEKVKDTADYAIARRAWDMPGGGGTVSGPGTAQNGAFLQLLGFPALDTTALAATTGAAGCCIFGNWADCWIPAWYGMEIRASDVAGDSFEKNQTHVRGLLVRDVIIRQAVSFCVNT